MVVIFCLGGDYRKNVTQQRGGINQLKLDRSFHLVEIFIISVTYFLNNPITQNSLKMVETNDTLDVIDKKILKFKNHLNILL